MRRRQVSFGADTGAVHCDDGAAEPELEPEPEPDAHAHARWRGRSNNINTNNPPPRNLQYSVRALLLVTLSDVVGVAVDDAPVADSSICE
eukprot:3357763-Rhodomonas_salina.5